MIAGAVVTSTAGGEFAADASLLTFAFEPAAGDRQHAERHNNGRQNKNSNYAWEKTSRYLFAGEPFASGALRSFFLAPFCGPTQ